MLNPIKEIYKFNQQAGLLGKGYDDFLESSFQIEDALEGFNLDVLPTLLSMAPEDGIPSPKTISRKIIWHTNGHTMTDVDRLDKACDAVVFAVGSMAKLGLNHHEITKALNIVMSANFAKLGAPKDTFGKQLKPEGWTGPEPELQKLLDARGTK